MKRNFFKLVLLSVIFVPNLAFGMYDFCESPADIRTEYWKDIPDYHPDNDNIKFEDMKNEHPAFPVRFRKSKKKAPTSKSEDSLK